MHRYCNPNATPVQPYATPMQPVAFSGVNIRTSTKKRHSEAVKCFSMPLVLLVVDNADKVEFVVYQRFQTKKESRLHCINITEISWQKLLILIQCNPSRFQRPHESALIRTSPHYIRTSPHYVRTTSARVQESNSSLITEQEQLVDAHHKRCTWTICSWLVVWAKLKNSANSICTHCVSGLAGFLYRFIERNAIPPRRSCH